MRRNIKILAQLSVAFVVVCCSKSDDENISHKKKSEAFMDKYRAGVMGITSSVGRKTAGDTTVFISGVEFPPGYDWRRDSLYGSIAGKIILFQNGQRILEIAAGGTAHASLSPDKHILMEGHIFTEFHDKGRTIIGCDGKDLFTLSGKHAIRGLVVKDSDTYALFQSLDGEGVTLTHNGETVLQRKNATVVGQMSSNTEYPSGALYYDSGHLYFAYWRPQASGSGKKAWFIVEDGEDTQLEIGEEGFYDIRIRNGEIVKNAVAAGRPAYFESTQDGHQSIVIAYHDGTLLISNPFMKHSEFTIEKYYFFSFRNAFMICPALYMAITPRESGAYPIFWKNGTATELEFNGFVTAIEASILPRQDT